MFNFGILINSFYDIFNKQQTIFEVILNLTFILILFIIAFIFYWDSINRSVINTSRCKAIIRNDDASYTVNFYDTKSKNNKLFSISYDNSRNHNVKINCDGVCNKNIGETGVFENKIQIPYYDYKEQKIDNSYTKTCLCDKNYINNRLYTAYLPDFGVGEGDKFLEDYYTDLYNNSLSINSYDKKLYFPV